MCYLSLVCEIQCANVWILIISQGLYLLLSLLLLFLGVKMRHETAVQIPTANPIFVTLGKSCRFLEWFINRSCKLIAAILTKPTATSGHPKIAAYDMQGGQSTIVTR